MSEFNPRTQGISSVGTLASFRKGRDMKIADIKEKVNTETGDVIPAHKALAFFTAKKNPDGTKMRDAKGNLIPESNSVEFVSFGPSVGELNAAELTAHRNELEVGSLAESGNYVLYKPANNGFVGEEVEEW